MSIERKRLSPEESRAAALEAASAILIEAGPQAVTLKAVSSRMGRTHANLLHHFGSASGLQMALAAHPPVAPSAVIPAPVRRTRLTRAQLRRLHAVNVGLVLSNEGLVRLIASFI
jgi:hypothetical protein